MTGRAAPKNLGWAQKDALVLSLARFTPAETPRFGPSKGKDPWPARSSIYGEMSPACHLPLTVCGRVAEQVRQAEPTGWVLVVRRAGVVRYRSAAEVSQSLVTRNGLHCCINCRVDNHKAA